jgi:hypothetical protein
MGERDNFRHDLQDPASRVSTGREVREFVQSRVVAGLSREKLFERLSDVESFPEWGYGLRSVRLRPGTPASSKHDGLQPGARIEFGLRAAGINHRVTSLVTEVDPPRLIEWRYLSGATGYGGWVLEDEGGERGGLVRMTLSTDYSVEPKWLDRLAHRPFFRNLISDLLSRSLRRLGEDLERSAG